MLVSFLAFLSIHPYQNQQQRIEHVIDDFQGFYRSYRNSIFNNLLERTVQDVEYRSREAPRTDR